MRRSSWAEERERGTRRGEREERRGGSRVESSRVESNEEEETRKKKELEGEGGRWWLRGKGGSPEENDEKPSWERGLGPDGDGRKRGRERSKERLFFDAGLKMDN